MRCAAPPADPAPNAEGIRWSEQREPAVGSIDLPIRRPLALEHGRSNGEPPGLTLDESEHRVYCREHFEAQAGQIERDAQFLIDECDELEQGNGIQQGTQFVPLCIEAGVHGLLDEADEFVSTIHVNPSFP